MKEMLEFSQEDIGHVLRTYVQDKYKWAHSKVSFEVEPTQSPRVSAIVERLPEPKGEDPLW